MKINARKIRLVFLYTIVLTINVTFVLAQERQQDEELKKITAFLNANNELQNYSVNGFSGQFTGELGSIPKEIQSELSQTFPKYKFYIAKMNVLIDAPSKKFDLILIADNNSSEVRGFVWENYWTLPFSKSFPLMLQGHQVKSKDEAVSQVKTLAKLLTFSSGKIGVAKIQKGKIKVELIKGEGVLGILEVKINNNLQFGQLKITDSKGKKIKLFV